MHISLKHPFSMLVFGGRGVRKTEFRKKLLRSTLIAPPPERIVWSYAKHQQDLFEELMKMNVEHAEGIPGELDKYFKKNKRNLIILHQRVLKLLNCLHAVFKNPRDNSQFATIARQIRPDRVKFVTWVYKDATSSLHSYLMLDLNQTLRKGF